MLFGSFLNHAGITWIIRFCTNVFRPIQPKCMPSLKQGGHNKYEETQIIYSNKFIQSCFEAKLKFRKGKAYVRFCHFSISWFDLHLTTLQDIYHLSHTIGSQEFNSICDVFWMFHHFMYANSWNTLKKEMIHSIPEKKNALHLYSIWKTKY